MRVIKLGDFGDYSKRQVEKLLEFAVLETDTLLKSTSPVDLGRFRLSWAIGQNATPFPGLPPGDYRGQPVPPPRRMGYRSRARWQCLQHPQQPAICRKVGYWRCWLRRE
jgi:hypothetical protein